MAVLTFSAGFEFELATNQSANDPLLVNSSVTKLEKNDGGVLLIEALNEDHTDMKDSSNSFSLVSFMFTVQEIDSLNAHIAKRSERLKAWQEKIDRDEKQLSEEMTQYGDIVRVGVVDVYRNLPRKLLRFHQWIAENFKVRFVLKTDDDCLVDMENILTDLKKIENKPKVWWGSFRNEWLVERHGKWKERSFSSSVYPKFACGSGSVVSEDIHHWIVTNSDHLHVFQGEDVAMGIWLAAINPAYVQDNNWKCDKTCDSGFHTLPELKPEELRQHWNNKISCKDPCTQC